MAKSKKPHRPKPRLPKGLRDIDGMEVKAMRAMINKLSDVYELYGFDPLDTPTFEFSDCLGKFLPDDDRPNQGVFSFQMDDEDWVSLRYDLTAPLARHVAANYDQLAKPFRRYQTGFVWRNEKPGPGRFRQFMQFDADIVGAGALSADGELAMLAADGLEALGLSKGQYVIKLSNRKLLDGVLEAAGLDLASEQGLAQRLIAMRAIDKIDRLGANGVADLLGDGRKDASGDFTKGAGLAPKARDLILNYLSIQTDKRADLIKQLAGIVDVSELGRTAIEELTLLDKIFTASDYGTDQICFDPAIVRGLDYYTGPVMEAELTFESKDENGEAARFGSVGGGGRYDGLVGRFKGQDVPATGFSIGLSRLYAALRELDKLDETRAQKLVVVLVMDPAHIADYMKMVKSLRRAGVRTEVYTGTSGMRAQMKYADKRGASIVVIQGEDERAKGELMIKDFDEGARLSKDIKDNEEWRSGRPAQFSIQESELVQTITKMIAV